MKFIGIIIYQMNFLHLKYAVEVAKTGSLNKAAENLYMEQPNLSRAIKELESNLGIAIFERSYKGMVATAEGETFLAYAKNILSQVDEIESLYHDKKNPYQKFSISVPRASYISEAFVQFSKKIDISIPIELVYKETNALRAIKNILEADYKLGIIRYAENYDKYFKDMLSEKGLHYELVSEFSYVLIMSKNHSLAKKKNISYSDLKDFTEIAHADPFVPSIPLSVIRKEELPTDVVKRIYVFERSSQFELLSANTDTFMWVSSVPKKLLERFNLVQIPCKYNNKIYRDVLIYREGYKLSKLDNDFITELCKSKRENIG